MSSIITDIRRQWDNDDRVLRLIFVNCAVFLFFGIVHLVCFVLNSGNIVSEVSRHFSASSDIFFMLRHPWAVISYQFLHLGFGHLFQNMLMLYVFGGIIQDLLGKRTIVPLYLLGGTCGYLLYLVGAYILPAHMIVYDTLLGASGAVVGIILAAAVKAPDYEVGIILIGPVKIKYIAAVSILLYVLDMPNGNLGGQLAHLGGALAGWQFIVQIDKGRNFANFFNHYWGKISTVFAFYYNKIIGNKTPQMTGSRGGKPRQPQSVFEQPHSISENESSSQKMLDAILEKIKRSGYPSLTDSERAFLHKESKK
jgi:membrane associated rhomboid family serine protease